ncbi:transcription initiation factor TFIID subunit 5-like [Teleopsis dalmanni]|uniref:transcription initiation factor TFIID subunit 5-like n=1 Tax=Teleopsis dalmanni TaxID=139649 RepID=UPI0018CF0380|nr:transcription initiation factor TFIID subunit 5-like [Teleopsis dalmanni]
MSDYSTINGNGVVLDKQDMYVLMKLVKKYNLKQSEEILFNEANIRREDLVELNDPDNNFNHNELITRDGEHSPSYDKSIDPKIYIKAFEDLRTFVGEALDIYKHELSMVLYPILVQIYFKFIEHNMAEAGQKFIEKYGKDLDYFYREDLQQLLLLRKRVHLVNNDLVEAMDIDKFIIRMSRDSHSLFKRHIQDRKQEVIADIVANHLHFDTYEGTARSKEQCAITSGASIGEAKRQDNKVRVYFGLPKEIDIQLLTTPAPAPPEEEEDNDPDAPDKPKKKKPKKDPLFSKKSKTDPNAPANDRIPLPEMKDSDKLEKLKSLRETMKRIALNRDSLPSVCFYTILNAHNTVCSAEVSEDSTILAVGLTDSSIKVWSLTPSKLREMKTAEQLKDVDKDSEDVVARMMDERSGEQCRVLYGHNGPVFRCAFSPDKLNLLSCSEDGTLRLWSLLTWTCVVVYKGHLFPIWDVRFSPHGYYFASGSYDKTVRLWATDTYQPLRIFVGHLADVSCVQFHPNSNYIASGSEDRTVRLWDVFNGQLVRLMTGHKGTITSLAFSTCGRYLASGAADNIAIVWDLAQGQLITTLVKHTGTLNTMTFSRDGTILAIGGLDNYLTLWDFSKLAEEYINQSTNASHNPDINDGEKYLLRAYPTKATPFLTLHFTRRNLLFGVGTFRS